VVGVLNQPQTPQAMQQLLQTPQAPRVTVPGSAMSAGSVGKPQQLWRDEINNSDQPFVPKLRSKPNAIAPFELRVEHGAEEVPGLLGLTPGGSSPRRQPSSWYANPYAAELAEFHPTEVQLLPRETGMPAPLHQTPCTWVATEQALHAVAQKLSGVDEFGVSVVEHSYRSYRGFIALMQISTRDEDFLLDALELRRSLPALNDAFTNPRITKVMHQADSAVQWLQRDFGLYLVSLFDTHQAARVLEMQSYALAHLVKHTCGVDIEKSVRTSATAGLADWRVRPLPDDLVRSAREDAHFLLHAYADLRLGPQASRSPTTLLLTRSGPVSGRRQHYVERC
jgi:exosome complex exonuclease RRP6